MSNKSTKSEEPAVAAVVTAIISERKNANWKRKSGPAWVKLLDLWYITIITATWR